MLSAKIPRCRSHCWFSDTPGPLFHEFVDRLTQRVERLLVVVLHGVDDAVLDMVLQDHLADVGDRRADRGDLDKDLALDRLRRCVQDALKEDLRVTDTDDRKGMLSTPGRGPSVYETAAVYSEIFRRARAGRAVAPLAVYSAAKYDETMTAARKRASVMLGL